MTCPKCGAEMTLARTIEFEQGPAKGIWECEKNANHVLIQQVGDLETPSS